MRSMSTIIITMNTIITTITMTIIVTVTAVTMTMMTGMMMIGTTTGTTKSQQNRPQAINAAFIANTGE